MWDAVDEKRYFPLFSVDPTILFFSRQVYKSSGRRTKRSASGLQLSSHGREPIEDSSLLSCNRDLQYVVMFARRQLSLLLCRYTDASDVVRSDIRTQVSRCDLPEPREDQRQSPLPFSSRRFSGSPLG